MNLANCLVSRDSHVAGRPMLGGLKLVLNRFRVFNDAEDRRLPALLKDSREAQTNVSTMLAEHGTARPDRRPQLHLGRRRLQGRDRRPEALILFERFSAIAVSQEYMGATPEAVPMSTPLIGARIKALREQRSLSQDQLAQLFGSRIARPSPP